jgi:hypothetical protein
MGVQLIILGPSLLALPMGPYDRRLILRGSDDDDTVLSWSRRGNNGRAHTVEWGLEAATCRAYAAVGLATPMATPPETVRRELACAYEHLPLLTVPLALRGAVSRVLYLAALDFPFADLGFGEKWATRERARATREPCALCGLGGKDMPLSTTLLSVEAAQYGVTARLCVDCQAVARCRSQGIGDRTQCTLCNNLAVTHYQGDQLCAGCRDDEAEYGQKDA